MERRSEPVDPRPPHGARPHGSFLRRFGAPALALAAVLLSLAVYAPLPASAAPTAPASRPAAGFPTPIHHVIVIWFENRELGQVLRQTAPFEQYLATRYALSGQFYSVRHDSEPDYLAATSGISPDLFSVGKYNVSNVGDLVGTAGLTWASYFEGMPSPCYGNYDWSAGYEVTHNPFVQYRDIWRNYAYCASHVLPFNAASWTSSVNAGTIPNYVWIGPSIFHDQHSGTLGAGSAWLQSVVNPVLNSSLFSSTAIIVTYDEGLATDFSGFNSSFGGNIYTAIASPLARAGYNSSHPYQTYSVLTTAEWLLGLGHTGQNDSWAKFPPMKDMFTFGGVPTTPPPGSFTISGRVTNASNGLPVGGAHVVTAGNYSWGVDTNANGVYSLPVPAGVHTIWVTDNGYFGPPPFTLSVTGNIANKNFALRLTPFRLYTVSGTVHNAVSGAAIPNGLVLFSGPGVLKANTTDVNGTYTTPTPIPNGTYNVTASATNFTSQTKVVVVNGAAVGGVDFALSPSAVNQTLRVAASAMPSSGHAPLAVRFLARISGGVAPYNCTWHYGDGTPTAGTCAPTHRYNASGAFGAVVQVADSAGAVATATTNVSVLPGAKLIASASVRSTACNGTGYSAVLVATASGGAPPYTDTWAFGDGTTATGATVSHFYAQRTAHTATVTTQDSANASAVANVSVAPPSTCSSTGLGGGLLHTIVAWVRSHVLIVAAVVAAVAILIGAGLAVRARRRAPAVVRTPPSP